MKPLLNSVNVLVCFLELYWFFSGIQHCPRGRGTYQKYLSSTPGALKSVCQSCFDKCLGCRLSTPGMAAETRITLRLDVPEFCFCSSVLETPAHLFFCCPLARRGADWIQTLLSAISVEAPLLNILVWFFRDRQSSA